MDGWGDAGDPGREESCAGSLSLLGEYPSGLSRTWEKRGCNDLKQENSQLSTNKMGLFRNSTALCFRSETVVKERGEEARSQETEVGGAAVNSPLEAPGLKRGGFSLAGLLPGREKLFLLRVVTGFWLEARWSPLWRHPVGLAEAPWGPAHWTFF